jgi:hypothetical protein
LENDAAEYTLLGLKRTRSSANCPSAFPSAADYNPLTGVLFAAREEESDESKCFCGICQVVALSRAVRWLKYHFQQSPVLKTKGECNEIPD